MVRRSVYRATGKPLPPAPSDGQRILVTAKELEGIEVGGTVPLPAGALITPLARQVALERRISLISGRSASSDQDLSAKAPQVAVGADHGGFDLKQILKTQLRQRGYRVIDCGTDSPGSVDYPDYALAVAQLVSEGRAWRGILVDGAGIGSCMTANKVPGVRAAMCYDRATAVNSRAHNDANVLTLGAGMITPELARQIVETWLDTPAEAGRHARRVHKIMEVERQFLRKRGVPG
jgi:ribose 5-phosphate isomerase B